MQISKNGIDLIKKMERFEEQIYLCPAGKLSIGYGHVLTKNETYKIIDITIAESLLITDLNIAEFTVRKGVGIELTQGQYDALVSLVYNWGSANFLNSKGLKALNLNNIENTRIEFFDREKGVTKIKGIISEGLVNRRQKELLLFNS